MRERKDEMKAIHVPIATFERLERERQGKEDLNWEMTFGKLTTTTGVLSPSG